MLEVFSGSDDTGALLASLNGDRGAFIFASTVPGPVFLKFVSDAAASNIGFRGQVGIGGKFFVVIFPPIYTLFKALFMSLIVHITGDIWVIDNPYMADTCKQTNLLGTPPFAYPIPYKSIVTFVQIILARTLIKYNNLREK